MDVRKVAVGGVFWFMGIIVPVVQHALLFIAAGVAAKRDNYFSNGYLAALDYFYRLPAMTWVYLVAMWFVGTWLVVDGLTTPTENKKEQPSPPTSPPVI